MRTRRHRGLRRLKTRKHNGGKKTGKKWVTAIEAAQKTLSKTGSLESARKTLRKQALTNARKLFGSISSM
jgi:hypothetical protein